MNLQHLSKSKGQAVVHYVFSDINNLSTLASGHWLQLIHKPLHCASTAACSTTARKLIQVKNYPIFLWLSYVLAGLVP